MGLFSDGFKELKKTSEPLYKAPKSIQVNTDIFEALKQIIALYKKCKCRK